MSRSLLLAARRSPLALAFALAALSALSACATPTSPDPTTPSATVRHSGYTASSGRDSTGGRGGE